MFKICFPSLISKMIMSNDNNIKVTGFLYYNPKDICESVCLYVPKDLANCWTDMVFLYNLASNRPREGLKLELKMVGGGGVDFLHAHNKYFFFWILEY